MVYYFRVFSVLPHSSHVYIYVHETKCIKFLNFLLHLAKIQKLYVYIEHDQ